ncbi:hypothetical protein LL965_22760 [Xanthomonas cassavae CFBP 4642]|uniref:RiboL-PSP-HEPN domain-containing protein n=1 Tax=Xanthomonas cassavae CFBP 4642 TaxID=1219375 RepID=A0ABS8HKQ0_9XANT|nr:hypothetical protein [Xanthomonas cassavae]MCC4622712.1 hypothetical protein [Xanthomonas cassavae CFBP 4642]
MPSFPRIDKGEGFIRTHDLLEELQADVGRAYEALGNDRQSQYLRRSVVRAVFSFIEACVETIKVEIRSNIRTGLFNPELTEKEQETLGALHLVGDRRSDKLLPLDANLKRTFRLAAKVWGLTEFKLATGGENFADFLLAKEARNRLTHPKNYYDIQVTDDDMHCHTIAYHWVLGEFSRLFRLRVVDIARSLAPEDGERLLQSTGVGGLPSGA